MARVSNEQKLKFERAVFDFLNANPSATTQSVGEALYDTWRSPGPEGNRPKEERATDWAKRKLKSLAKNGKVYQPSRDTWVANEPTGAKRVVLRKAAKNIKKSENGFAPLNVFEDKTQNGADEVIDNTAFIADFSTTASTNSPFIRGLLRTAERHGTVELSEPMLHALIEEMTMLMGSFDN
tara:strand:+ start:440 stop:982 length:543 start_codon:yes stop_codon:yes gene_type:complete